MPQPSDRPGGTGSVLEDLSSWLLKCCGVAVADPADDEGWGIRGNRIKCVGQVSHCDRLLYAICMLFWALEHIHVLAIRAVVIRPPLPDERLDRFLRHLPPGWNCAIEIRNKEYLTAEYFDLLSRHNMAHVVGSTVRHAQSGSFFRTGLGRWRPP